jgi:hypothetical protein
MCLERSTIKVVSTVSDPPTLTDEDLSRIQLESQRLHAAFTARTAGMEVLTADDLKIRVLQRSRSSSPKGKGLSQMQPRLLGADPPPD